MKKHLFPLIVFSIFHSSSLFAQTLPTDHQLNSIETIVNGINDQNYKQMKKPWGAIGKILISKKHLRQEYEPFHDKYGSCVIDTIVFNSKYSASAQLFTPNEPNKRTFLNFIFNDKGKLQGLGFGYPIFIYRKTTPNKELDNATIIEKIDSIVQRRAHKPAPYDFNGAVLVTSNDSIIYKQSVGQLNFVDNTPLNDSSLFLLASCSKQFTAIAIMKLMEDGQLQYNDPVQKYLPEFPYSTITVEHLLTHTSGLPSYFDLLDKHWDKTQFATNQDVLNLLSKHEPNLRFKPNELFEYSNTGYVILSLIIESVSKESYGEYLKSNIFEPLEMTHTLVYHRRFMGDTLDNYAIGAIYSKSQNKYIYPDSSKSHSYVYYMDRITGDDGVSSTILDLKKWNEGLKYNELVSKETMAKATSCHLLSNGKTSDYGYGIMLKKGENIHEMEFHTGGWPGYSTMIVRFPNLNKEIIVLSNNGYNFFDSLVDEISVLLTDNYKVK